MKQVITICFFLILTSCQAIDFSKQSTFRLCMEYFGKSVRDGLGEERKRELASRNKDCSYVRPSYVQLRDAQWRRATWHVDAEGMRVTCEKPSATSSISCFESRYKDMEGSSPSGQNANIKMVEEKDEIQESEVKNDSSETIASDPLMLKAKAKAECEELGFTPKTEAYGDCVLRLLEMN